MKRILSLLLVCCTAIAVYAQDIAVKTNYNGSNVLSYYRLDFNPPIDGHPFGQILRNHRYEFNIQLVGRVGYSTAQEAADNPAFGMNAGLILWQDYIKYMYFDDDNYLGISQNIVQLSGAINSSESILVETDASTLLFRWVDRYGVPIGSPAPPPSTELNDGIFRVSSQSGAPVTIDFVALTSNPIGEVDITHYVEVSAGALQIVMTIIQGADDEPGGLRWGTANVDAPGTFAASQGEAGMFYQWNRNVAWSVTGTVTGWNSIGAEGVRWETAVDPCPDGWRLPTSDELRILISSPGQRWRIGGDYPNPGVWFAPTQAEANDATLANPGNAIFLPAAGQCH